jgi:death-on-curing protein
VRREPHWISKPLALAIHDRLIASHGGAAGVRDDGALEAALMAPRNHFAYSEGDVFVLAAVYAYGMTRNHPFMDGNKRVALTMAAAFLQWNGYRLEAPEQDAVAATVGLSDRSMGLEDFGTWLRDASKKISRTKGTKP